MTMPGLTAAASLYTSTEAYHGVTQATAPAPQSVSMSRLPFGLCQKACGLCNNPSKGGMWCQICDRCFPD
jgi:hypothetical protein